MSKLTIFPCERENDLINAYGPVKTSAGIVYQGCGVRVSDGYLIMNRRWGNKLVNPGIRLDADIPTDFRMVHVVTRSATPAEVTGAKSTLGIGLEWTQITAKYSLECREWADPDPNWRYWAAREVFIGTQVFNRMESTLSTSRTTNLLVVDHVIFSFKSFPPKVNQYTKPFVLTRIEVEY